MSATTVIAIAAATAAVMSILTVGTMVYIIKRRAEHALNPFSGAENTGGESEEMPVDFGDMMGDMMEGMEDMEGMEEDD